MRIRIGNKYFSMPGWEDLIGMEQVVGIVLSELRLMQSDDWWITLTFTRIDRRCARLHIEGGSETWKRDFFPTLPDGIQYTKWIELLIIKLENYLQGRNEFRLPRLLDRKGEGNHTVFRYCVERTEPRPDAVRRKRKMKSWELSHYDWIAISEYCLKFPEKKQWMSLVNFLHDSGNVPMPRRLLMDRKEEGILRGGFVDAFNAWLREGKLPYALRMRNRAPEWMYDELQLCVVEDSPTTR